MTVRAMSAAALSLAIAGCQHSAPTAAQHASLEAQLRSVDQHQSNVTQSGDMASLEALMHPAYAVHLPNGGVLDRQRTLALARTGAFALEKHRRVQERVVVGASTSIVMGVDHLESPPPLATRGERTRRYTNVYVLEQGRWRHIARHFHLLP